MSPKKNLNHNSSIENNLKWERIPCINPPEWAKFPKEDLFLCHNCKNWFPWIYYGNGKFLAIPHKGDFNIYAYLNDDKDREGRRWACDFCIDKILYIDNNIIIAPNDDIIISQ
jgi:hypothetical protein